MRSAQSRPRHPRPRVTLDQLHTFLAVAEREHVTAAAEALGLSQGSVSGVVRRLESTLGLPLLQRVGRNVQLTDVGRALRQLAVRVLEDVGQIEELRAGYLAFERGELTVAAGRVMGAHRLSSWLAPFVADHPEINVRLALAPMRSLVTMLIEGRADIILAGSSVREPGIETVVLEHTQLVTVVAAHHPLASSKTAVRDLVTHRHLAHERGSATEALAAHALGTHVDPENTLELEEGALHAALLAGLGFAAMPRSVVEQDIIDGRMVIIPLPGRSVSQSFAAARRRDLHTPAVEAFWAHLKRIAVDQSCRVASVGARDERGVLRRLATGDARCSATGPIRAKHTDRQRVDRSLHRVLTGRRVAEGHGREHGALCKRSLQLRNRRDVDAAFRKALLGPLVDRFLRRREQLGKRRCKAGNRPDL